MIRRISDLIGRRLCALAAAVAGAIALAGCADTPLNDSDAVASTPGTATAAAKAATPAPAATRLPPSPSATPPTKTVTLPAQGRVSLAEYRAQMRQQLMQTENASADVADCAAHASWVVPRSASFDALKIPTGALGAGQATVEPWDGRFSQGKQAVPVSSVVTFAATAHKRNAEAQWEPVKVRCGYAEGMMLAYELLDGSGTVISEPAAAPAVHGNTRQAASAKGHKGSKAAKSGSGKASGTKSTKASSSSSSKSTTKSTSKSGKKAQH
ncbi:MULTISPECIES: BspC domain-containing protein [unclassified Cupriavidus]|uniref:BspC domain-containing protein n=1 Tax=unclassified Cupriavidus TaxID=2640874 RepID=UPI003F936D9B